MNEHEREVRLPPIGLSHANPFEILPTPVLASAMVKVVLHTSFSCHHGSGRVDIRCNIGVEEGSASFGFYLSTLSLALGSTWV